MGLDVYLYKFENFEASKKVQEEYEEKLEAIWKAIGNGRNYDGISDDEKNSARKQTAQLERDLKLKEHQGEKIEFNSFKYPLHYFKIGYFRSSYNSGGINRILGDAIGMDLYSIFNPNNRYEFAPDWEEAKTLTEEAIKKFSDYLKNGAYRVYEVFNFHSKATDSKEALKVFFEELERNKQHPGFTDYSNSNGEFMMNGFNINAVINGKDRVYLIYKDENTSWYLEALEIVLETIEHVLSQPDKEKYVLLWSS